MEWRVAEAKNKFSEVMTKALTCGPQRIRRRDQVVVVISESDYQRLTGKRKTLVDHLLSGPGLEGVDLTRDQSPIREVEW
jgi:prevent-host-death family protein